MALFDTGKKDYTAEVTTLIAQIDATINDIGLSSVDWFNLLNIMCAFIEGLEEAIALLLVMEKKCRVNNDPTNLNVVSKYMIKLCKDQQNWFVRLLIFV